VVAPRADGPGARHRRGRGAGAQRARRAVLPDRRAALGRGNPARFRHSGAPALDRVVGPDAGSRAAARALALVPDRGAVRRAVRPGHGAARAAFRLVRRLRAPAPLRSFHPDRLAVPGGRREGIGRRLRSGRTHAVDPLPPAPPEPPPVVALDRSRDRATRDAGAGGGAGLDRSVVRSLRADARPGTRGEDRRPGTAGGDRGRPGLRGGQERRHTAGQRLRVRTRRNQADRAVGYPGGPTQPGRGALRHGARDGALRSRPHGPGYTWGHAPRHRLDVRGTPGGRRAPGALEPPLRVRAPGRSGLAASADPGGRRRVAGGDAGRTGHEPSPGTITRRHARS